MLSRKDFFFFPTHPKYLTKSLARSLSGANGQRTGTYKPQPNRSVVLSVWESKGLVSQISPESLNWNSVVPSLGSLKTFALPCRITYSNIDVYLHCWKYLTSATQLGQTTLYRVLIFKPHLLSKHKPCVFNSLYCQNLSVEGIFQKPQEENIVET